MATDIPVPDTGSIETDLQALARSISEAFTSPTGQAILAAMFTGAAHLPEIAAARRHVFDDRLTRAEPVLRRATKRGRLPEGTDPAEVLKTLAAPIYLRLLITAEPVDETTADQAVHVTLAAARGRPAGGARHELDLGPGYYICPRVTLGNRQQLQAIARLGGHGEDPEAVFEMQDNHSITLKLRTRQDLPAE
ncbi:TetR-like C-terminal domain-containing protein [Nonomuraea sp. NPDC050404]|uniref:TetR-like C-terminal domain-containing protein n=1 Tax=Nonomuraea sp. NPDC050404 TaxID=3155783 RepID=UPI0033F512D5